MLWFSVRVAVLGCVGWLGCYVLLEFTSFRWLGWRLVRLVTYGAGSERLVRYVSLCYV